MHHWETNCTLLWCSNHKRQCSRDLTYSFAPIGQVRIRYTELKILSIGGRTHCSIRSATSRCFYKICELVSDRTLIFICNSFSEWGMSHKMAQICRFLESQHYDMQYRLISSCLVSNWSKQINDGMTVFHITTYRYNSSIENCNFSSAIYALIE
jgi:hypothetical protein